MRTSYSNDPKVSKLIADTVWLSETADMAARQHASVSTAVLGARDVLRKVVDLMADGPSQHAGLTAAPEWLDGMASGIDGVAARADADVRSALRELAGEARSLAARVRAAWSEAARAGMPRRELPSTAA